MKRKVNEGELITRDGMVLNEQVANDLIEMMKKDGFNYGDIECYVSMHILKNHEEKVIVTEGKSTVHVEVKKLHMIGDYILNIDNDKNEIGYIKVHWK